MLRILHLSDLHFGKLQQNAWNHVKNRCRNDTPDIIIISGDVCDCPFFHFGKFKVASQEILSLADDCHAAVIVAPGNHDVGIKGSFNLGFLTRFLFNRWFKKKIPEDKTLITTLDSEKIKGLLDKHHMLIVPFDSTRRPFISSGTVKGKEIDALCDFIRSARGRESIHGLRIAVVHHHPISVPYADRQHWREPFMVFKNAGTFISRLYLMWFDLLLHGHKHHENFCKIAFGKREEDVKEFSILGAGSTTAADRKNYNFINVFDNGEVAVEQFFFGGDENPESDYFYLYTNLEERKNAVYQKSWDLQDFKCEKMEKIVSIEKNGSALTEVKFNNLIKSRPDFPKTSRPFSAEVDSGSISSCRLDEPSRDKGFSMRIYRRSNSKRKVGTINLIEIPTNGPGISYGWEFRTSKSYAMNRQQYTRLNKGTQFEEWTSADIRFPCKQLKMRVKFPESFANYIMKNRIKLRVYYNPSIMHASRTTTGGELKAHPTEMNEWRYDPSNTNHEKENFQRAGERTWELKVKYPLVGYKYEIRWSLP